MNGRQSLAQRFGADITLKDIDLPRRAAPPPPSPTGDGANNAQKTPIGQYLDAKVYTRVSNLLQARSGRLPATLVRQMDGNGGTGKTGTIWLINFEMSGDYTLPQVTVPVHGSEFSRLPYKQGDKGYVTWADVDTTSMSNLNQQSGSASYARPGNLSSLLWHPVGNTQFTPQIDPNAHETYGRDSGTITHDGTQKSLVRTHATDGTVISSGGSGGATSASQADGPHKMTTHPTNGTSIETPAAHTLQASNATLDAQGNQSNQGNSTTAQNITSTGGNISAPSGAMSAQSGSFASGSMGGVGFANGIVGGLGAFLNTVTGLISGTSVSAGSVSATNGVDGGSSVVGDAVRARKYAQLPSYTVAQLFATLPPAAQLVGARVFVVDVSSSTTFGSVIGSSGGGGSGAVPAYCDGASPANWRVG